MHNPMLNKFSNRLLVYFTKKNEYTFVKLYIVPKV